ncbi:MAG TPA: cupredoxin domain-containing protein [Candidatus Dormibacteraeota bacterium]|nr:cupredoxin domain-containing protein [Candidatus Dormibacteraeota bacterium]
MDVIARDLQSAWNGVIGITEKLVIPDWGGLVALIPVFLAIAVVLFYVWEARRWATAGPTHRGITPRQPLPPPGVHMPGPSFAPIFAAVGAFLLFFGIIVRGLALWLGAVALVATLLYWLREAVRDYEAHVERTRVPVPAVGTQGPPPGVHLPAPSFRPILVSLAACVMFAGLVAGPAILVAGLILLVGALLGWLRDARVEYVATEVADRTGHLEAGPAPHFPTRSLIVGIAVVSLAVLVNAGVFSGGAGGGTATASGGSGGAAGGSPPAASAGASQVSADVTITAQGIAFATKAVTAKAGAAFTVAFANQDNGVPHNVDIKDSSGTSKFKGDIVSGVTTTVYHVPALTAGTYTFVCDVHPNMSGTLTVK